MQNGPSWELRRFQVAFQQHDSLLVGVFLIVLQKPDFVEQGPHVDRGITIFFGLLADRFYERGSSGRLVFGQELVDSLPAGG